MAPLPVLSRSFGHESGHALRRLGVLRSIGVAQESSVEYPITYIPRLGTYLGTQYYIVTITEPPKTNKCNNHTIRCPTPLLEFSSGAPRPTLSRSKVKWPSGYPLLRMDLSSTNQPDSTWRQLRAGACPPTQCLSSCRSAWGLDWLGRVMASRLLFPVEAGGAGGNLHVAADCPEDTIWPGTEGPLRDSVWVGDSVRSVCL